MTLRMYRGDKVEILRKLEEKEEPVGVKEEVNGAEKQP